MKEEDIQGDIVETIPEGFEAGDPKNWTLLSPEYEPLKLSER